MVRPIRSKRAPIEEPAINLTALIDVVFVILIIFILIAPLLELDRVELANAPKEAPDNHVSINEASPISINVHADNSVWVNREKVPQDKIADRLRKAKARFPNVRPQVFHDKKAHFGTYQTVKNAAEEAGFKELDIVLKPM